MNWPGARSVTAMRRMRAAYISSPPVQYRAWDPGQLPKTLENFAADPERFRRNLEREAHDASMLEWRYRNSAAE